MRPYFHLTLIGICTYQHRCSIFSRPVNLFIHFTMLTKKMSRSAILLAIARRPAHRVASGVNCRLVRLPG